MANNLNQSLTASKRYINKMNPRIVKKQIVAAARSAIGKALAGKGWVAKHHLSLKRSNYSYVYQARVVFTRSSQREYGEEIFLRQFSNIRQRFILRVATYGWRTCKEDEAAPTPQEVTVGEAQEKTPPAPPQKELTGADAIIIPDNWKDYFSHIYDRDDQIAEVMESIRTAKETSMEVRNHVCAWGEPGCAKSEVCMAIYNMLGSQAVKRLDATSTTKAGAEKLLLELAEVPPILILEELEKVNEANLPWLLGIMDDRSVLIKTNARIGSVTRQIKCLVIATVNNMEKFQKFHEGALASRFNVPIPFPTPDRALLRRILLREVQKIPGGKVEWVEPALDYGMGVERTYSARRLKAIMSNARDRLLTGEFQRARERMQKSMARD